MAMTRADIDYQRMRCGGGAGQGLAKALIHSLADQEFDDGTVHSLARSDHNAANASTFLTVLVRNVNKYLATSVIIYHPPSHNAG